MTYADVSPPFNVQIGDHLTPPQDCTADTGEPIDYLCMYPKLTKVRRPLPGTKLILLALLTAVPSTTLKALDEKQRVSFSTTFTEIRTTQTSSLVGLKRFASDPLNQPALSLAVEVRYPQSKGAVSAYFPAGSSDGTCTVQFPNGDGAGAAPCITLHLPETNDVEPFSRRAHVVRRKPPAATQSDAVINAVIFSGVEAPSQAVEGAGIYPSVVGGIVALGGSPSPVVSFQARLTPRMEYASGEWTPPLCPQVMIIQLSTWKSQAAQ